MSETDAPKIIVDGVSMQPLFFKKAGGSGKPLALADVSQITKEIMEKAGVPSRFKPQSLRSAASSAAVDDGAPIEQVLAQGRWASKQMWKKYYRPTGRNKKSKNLNLQQRLRK